MKRTRQSKRKLKSIFVMVLLTALLSIASTYAWFSANKEVSLTGIKARVAAAEGLQVSLDGEAWSASVAITQATLAAATDNVYSWPTQLTPVSTDGTTTGGKLNLKYGDVNATGDVLSSVAAETDLGNTKYISFDLYLKNSSSQTVDNLQLSTGTNVAINTTDGGKEGTGLENSIRAAIVMYGATAPMTAAGADIRALAAGTDPEVAIWEPNYNAHINEVVTNDRRITAANSTFNTLGLTAAASGTVYQVDTPDGKYYAEDTEHTLTLGDDNANLGAPTTMQTTGSVTAITNVMTVDETPAQITMTGNSIMKLRVYIWLEGQDPDCNDTASTGKAIDVAINLTKPAVATP